MAKKEKIKGSRTKLRGPLKKKPYYLKQHRFTIKKKEEVKQNTLF